MLQSTVRGCSRIIGVHFRRSLVKNAKILNIDTQKKLYSSEIDRENIPISRYPIPEKQSLHPDVQQVMDDTLEKTKFLPNVMKALAHREEEFKCFFQYYQTLMDKDTGSLTKADKELIVVATSATNNCLYCVVSHSAIHRIFSKKPYLADQVATNLEMANLTPRERAMLEFALKVAHMEPIDDQDFEELEQHGFDKEDAWDIGAITAFFAMSNRMAHLTAMRPNEEFYLMGRVKKSDK